MTVERRLAIDIAAIAEIGQQQDPEDPRQTFHWVPTDQQLADHLTKIRPPKELRDLLSTNWLVLKSRQALPGS
eukprot:10087312-Lingulodinium_polyedra.AAC.1